MKRFSSLKAYFLFATTICIVTISLKGFCQEQTFPAPAGWVNDFAGIINSEYKEQISQIAGELNNKTTAEITVVTIKDIGQDSIEDYAVHLFEKWGIGKKGKDNGVLILAALNQRSVRIEVGYGLESIITDGTVGSIIRDKIVPAFKEGKYGQGFLNATATVASLIAKDAGVELSSLKGISAEDYSTSSHVSLAQIIPFLIFLIIFIVFFGRILFFPILLGGFWRGGGGGFGGSGGFGGGFGGFGGGMSGGGGATGRW